MGWMTFTQTGCIWILLTLPFSVPFPLLVISFLLPTNPLFISCLSVSVSVPVCLSLGNPVNRARAAQRSMGWL